ncbi:uncharacterized protein BX663DRAFT_510904 [Cokeromyces recurvatus]|uniref:uncharacterized protein n=1 Tax=Cokeromyces recurvatus TaxID=90255 RepID=UPI0022204215|nr:uncharacterized protein BX663DRAFT_510904 [Cokeromyces recurvatus]KAI7902373.1 hypothetical protein BX663DRAFT_510904 [Cokeromyces recurvatus]
MVFSTLYQYIYLTASSLYFVFKSNMHYLLFSVKKKDYLVHHFGPLDLFLKKLKK